MDKIYDFIATVANANDEGVKISYFNKEADERRNRIERLAIELLGLQLKYGGAKTGVTQQQLEEAVNNALVLNDLIVMSTLVEPAAETASNENEQVKDALNGKEVTDALSKLVSAILKNK